MDTWVHKCPNAFGQFGEHHEATEQVRSEQGQERGQLQKSVQQNKRREYGAPANARRYQAVTMPCYHPLTGWQCRDGLVVFVSNLRRYDIEKEVQIPCGQCVGCRLERSRQWAMRCVHEASLYEQNAFVTLTYDEDHVAGLDYEDFQKFMKRLRKHYPQKIRFYMCGEYGPQLQRPHFHACLFNLDFEDKTPWGTGAGGEPIWRSATLERLWPQGFSTIGQVNFKTAAYTARYCMKKVTGKNAKFYYNERTPEFNHMSLKPGIGAAFLKKWINDVYPNDYVVIKGKEMKPPKYYDKIYRTLDEEKYEQIKYERIKIGKENYKDNTNERLKVKEIVTEAKVSLLKRKMNDY